MVVVYLGTNQGGVFEYGTLVCIVMTCDDHTGLWLKLIWFDGKPLHALQLDLQVQVKNTCG